MSSRNSSISQSIDWVLVWIYIFLVAVGIASIFGATYRDGDPIVQSFIGFKTDYSKQFLFGCISGVLGIFILLTDSKFFTATANLWYAFGLLLLLLVFPFHSSVKGTESIIRFGGFQFQPAEFCKISVALALAKYLSRLEIDFSKPKSQLTAMAIALVPAFITIAQKETGLALVYFAFFIVMFREGLPPIYLIAGFYIAVLVVATLTLDPNTLAIILSVFAILCFWFFRRQIKRKRRIGLFIVGLWILSVGFQRFAVPFLFTSVLQKHQVERIFSLIGKENPYAAENVVSDDKPAKKKDDNYNVRQSKIAIGNGGFLGKGLLKGTQSRYDFVPEQRTDFIFCTIGEGFGFVGSFIFLAVYLLLLQRIVTVAERQRSVFSRVYAYGVASVFFFHIAVNVMMTIGLAPVIGIPLPFVSYGGTALITFTVLLFILIRLDADRQMVLR